MQRFLFLTIFIVQIITFSQDKLSKVAQYNNTYWEHILLSKNLEFNDKFDQSTFESALQNIKDISEEKNFNQLYINTQKKLRTIKGVADNDHFFIQYYFRNNIKKDYSSIEIKQISSGISQETYVDEKAAEKFNALIESFKSSTPTEKLILTEALWEIILPIINDKKIIPSTIKDAWLKNSKDIIGNIQAIDYLDSTTSSEYKKYIQKAFNYFITIKDPDIRKSLNALREELRSKTGISGHFHFKHLSNLEPQNTHNTIILWLLGLGILGGFGYLIHKKGLPTKESLKNLFSNKAS